MTVHSIGIVGAGNISRQLHVPVLQNMPSARIAWIADADGQRARELAHGYAVSAPALSAASPDALPACDVVLLAIPVGVREPYYRALAARGTAVFAEKPFALSAAKHRELAGLFPEHRLACGFMRRMYDSTRLLRMAVHQRWFGNPLRMRAAEGARTTKTGADASHYDNFSAWGGGVLITQGIHPLDTALHILQPEDFEVEHRNMVLDDRIERKIEARIHLNCHDYSCPLDFCASWLDRQDNVIEIEFERALLRAGLTADAVVTLHDRSGKSEAVTLQSSEPGARTPNQAFFLEWREFLRGVELSRPSPISAASAELTTALVDALYARDAKEAVT